MTRRYTATSVIQLQGSAADHLGLSNLTEPGENAASDPMTLNVDLQTQVQILESESIALKVVKDLNLEQNKDFKPHFNPIGWVLGLLSPGGVSDPENASLENSPNRRHQVLEIFDKRLKVKVTPGTRLIAVSFTNRDPKVAADVANALVQAAIDFKFQTALDATTQVSQGLESQLADLRKHSEDLQARVVALQQANGLFGSGGTDAQGQPTVNSPVLQNLDRSTATLSQATMNRVLKEAVYDVVKSGNPEAISQLSGTSMGTEGATGVMNSLSLVQSLQSQESAMSAQIEKDAAKFGPAYPRLVQEKASLAEVKRSEQEELNRIAVRAKSDYDIAVKAEQGAKEAYQHDRQEATNLNSQSTEYAILSKEADQSQQLYEDLLKRLKEGGILEGLHSSNLTLVDVARAPAKPSVPNVPIYLGVALVLGVILGAIIALIADSTDDKIQEIEQIEALKVPFLGVLPESKQTLDSTSPLLLSSQTSAFNEAVRTLRSSLLVSRGGNPPQVVLIASGSPGEGKTLLAYSLAASLSQIGKKVLLVEGDMRRPVIGKLLGFEQNASLGLSNALVKSDTTKPVGPMKDHPNLYILPSGAKPLYPAELLSSQRIGSLLQQWRTEYDFIVLDSPPVLPVADSLLLEGVADATILVARHGYTTQVALKRTYKSLLDHAQDPKLSSIGVVLNDVSLESPTYYEYYGHRAGKNYQYGDEDKTPVGIA